LRLLDGTLVLSPTDLTAFLACGHLTALDVAVARDLMERPARGGQPVAAKYGDRHEAAYLAGLRADGRTVADVARRGPGTAGLLAAEAATVAAMRSGVDVVYQATFFDGRWVGHADFLVKDQSRPSGLGGWSYDVVDTKLSRTAHVAAFVQMASYAEHVERVQSVVPNTLTVVLGDGREQSLPAAQVMPYFRSVRARFLAALEAEAPYPRPVAHCAVCRWAERCATRRAEDDHPSLVAGIRRSQSDRLEAAGLTTVALLGGADRTALAGVRGEEGPVRRLAAQARLQVAARGLPLPPHELLPRVPGQGLDLIPVPDPGDVFFDLEGDPFVEGGLEYLFGLVEHGSDGPVYREWWAHDHAQERQALADVAAYLTERRAEHPGMHVYHYAEYEKTALLRLSDAARKHGLNTAADQVDELLRDEVLVDLYAIVRHGLLAGTASYSIKSLEPLYGFGRGGEVTNAADSITAYEEWLDGQPRDPGLLTAIGDYNRVDCESTLELRDWLLTLRDAPTPPATTAAGADAVAAPADADPGPGTADEGEEHVDGHKVSGRLRDFLAAAADVQNRVRARLPTDRSDWSDTDRARELLAGLLMWHRGESVVGWQEFFRRCSTPVEDLVDDATCVGDLTGPVAAADGSWPGPVVGQSRHHTYTFPAQDCALRVGDTVVDPQTRKAAGTLVAIDPAGTLVLSRGKSRPPLFPSALVPGGPPNAFDQQDALLRLARWLADHGIDSPLPQWGAARQLLLRQPPTLTTADGPTATADAATADGAGRPLLADGEDPVTGTVRLVASLRHATLPVQGPPGSGKTRTAAHVITDLVSRNLRVGITGPSHSVVRGVVAALVEHADKVGQPLRVVQKGDKAQVHAHPAVTRVGSNAKVVAHLDSGTVDVVAGTGWLFADQALEGRLHVLFVDEAGQFSLADTLAVSASAHNLVLLGDPQQLSQPGAARHPDGVDASGLAHALAGHATVTPDAGLFLPDTYRMHPAISAWVGATSYDGRLRSAPGLDRQRVEPRPDSPADLRALLTGAGVRYLPVPHDGARNASPVEAGQVARVVDALVGGTWTYWDGPSQRCVTRPFTVDDVLVVAPFNAHVAALRRVLPAGVRVGTVDKFQGGEAPVAVYSMATSTAEDSPRGVDFLYSLNRLNVAVSRARGLAVLVCSPALLAPRLLHVRHVPLVSALCSLAEDGRPFGGATVLGDGDCANGGASGLTDRVSP